MMQTRSVVPIQLTQSANGSRMRPPIADKIQTAVISIATSGIVFCGGFLWKTNSILSRIEQHQIDTDKTINNLETKVNNIQLDIRELRDKTIRIETKVNSTP